jgi:hypothetical protein
MLQREELAWAAGFFDGEGTVVYSLRRTPVGTAQRSLGIQVAQIDREPLERLVAVLGVGYVRGPYKTKNPNAKPYFVFAANGEESIQAIAAMLWPWLGSAKRVQFTEALRAFRSFVPDVALCEHGSPRQKCQPCRSEWTRRGWEKRRLAG